MAQDSDAALALLILGVLLRFEGRCSIGSVCKLMLEPALGNAAADRNNDSNARLQFGA